MRPPVHASWKWLWYLLKKSCRKVDVDTPLPNRFWWSKNVITMTDYLFLLLPYMLMRYSHNLQMLSLFWAPLNMTNTSWLFKVAQLKLIPEDLSIYFSIGSMALFPFFSLYFHSVYSQLSLQPSPAYTANFWLKFFIHFFRHFRNVLKIHSTIEFCFCAAAARLEAIKHEVISESCIMQYDITVQK